MADTKISLFCCLLAFLLICNGVSARLLENLFAKINLQDAEDHKVIHRRAAAAESSFSQAPALAPSLQPSLAPAPENQFPSSAASEQYKTFDAKPSLVDEETMAKLNHDDHDNDHDDNDDVDEETMAKLNHDDDDNDHDDHDDDDVDEETMAKLNHDDHDSDHDDDDDDDHDNDHDDDDHNNANLPVQSFNAQSSNTSSNSSVRKNPWRSSKLLMFYLFSSLLVTILSV